MASKIDRELITLFRNGSNTVQVLIGYKSGRNRESILQRVHAYDPQASALGGRSRDFPLIVRAALSEEQVNAIAADADVEYVQLNRRRGLADSSVEKPL